MHERLNSLWFGDRLGYLEQLSIKTALSVGHAYTLYSYNPHSLRGVPEGVDVRDAREVMDDPRRTSLFTRGFQALGSDFFRYEIFAKELGYWVDLDVLLLKPLAIADDYVFGWEKPGSINGAVLKLPARSVMLEKLRNIPERDWCPPFFGPKRRLTYWLQRISGHVELEDLPWGVAGPAMITYLAKTLGLGNRAQPVAVFYPLPYSQAELLFGPAHAVEQIIQPSTCAIHMWHSRLTGLASKPPPTGSFIEESCRRFGIDTRSSTT